MSNQNMQRSSFLSRTSNIVTGLLFCREHRCGGWGGANLVCFWHIMCVIVLNYSLYWATYMATLLQFRIFFDLGFYSRLSMYITATSPRPVGFQCKTQLSRYYECWNKETLQALSRYVLSVLTLLIETSSHPCCSWYSCSVSCTFPEFLVGIFI